MTTKTKNPKIHPVSFRIPDNYVDAYDYIRLMYPGGFTGWVLDCLEKVRPNHELLEQLRAEREKMTQASPVPQDVIDK